MSSLIPARFKLVLVALVLLLLGTPVGLRTVSAQEEPPVRYRDMVFERVETTKDVVYGSATDIPSGQPVELELDIYEPGGDTANERAVFVFIHGGGFVSGNKSGGRWYCELMARRGYFAVSISYRLNQGDIGFDGIPAATSDARQAVRWLRDHAGEYRLDSDRITIGGSSAGAITALFVAYTETERETSGTPSDVAAVMDLWGGLYYNIVEMTAGEPPLVIIHGTEDSVVPFLEAERLRDRAEEVGIPYAFYPLQGQGHAPFDPQQHMTWTAEFFYDRLWGDAPPEPTPAASPTATIEPSPTPTREPTVTATPTPTEQPPTFTVLFPLNLRGEL